jgi:hypothetical protein
MTTQCKILTPIVRLEQRRRALRTVKRGDEFETDFEILGWFVQLDGIAIRVGDDKPDGWEVGDMMCVTIEKADA